MWSSRGGKYICNTQVQIMGDHYTVLVANIYITFYTYLWSGKYICKNRVQMT